jgi:tetratricopeptide (TPR) repeat protein
LEESLSLARRARSLFEQLPEPRTEVVYALLSEATALIHLGRFEEALSTVDQGLAILARTEVENDPSAARLVVLRSRALLLLARPREALSAAREAMIRFEETVGMGWFDATLSPCDEAHALVQLGQEELAERSYLRCLGLVEKAFGAGHRSSQEAYRGLGEIRLRQRRPAEALKWLEKSLTLLHRKNAERGELGRVKFRLAQALWMQGQKGALAQEHLLGARQTLSGVPRARALREELEVWTQRNARASARRGGHNG